MTPSTAEVRRFVENLQGGGPRDLVTFDDGVAELEWGWRVMLQARRWVETRDFKDALVGHGPTYVSRTGRIFITGSRVPPELIEEGLAWELSGEHGLWARWRMRLRGWRTEECVHEVPRDEILARLPDGSWAAAFYRSWIGVR